MGVGRAVVKREAAQRVFARLSTRPGHDEGHRQLVLDLVGHRHDADLRHVGMTAEKLLDLAGIDVLAAALEHVVGAADEEHEAVGVAAHDVAGIVPAIDQARLRIGFAVEVAAHQRWRSDVQHTLVRVRADKLQIDALARIAE